MIDISVWNDLTKPDNIDEAAQEGDILEKVNGVLFLLQTKNGYNNVIAYRVENSPKNIVWTLYEYCMLIHDKHNIKCVRIEGDKGKYAFLERAFTRNEVRRDRTEKTRDVYYCNLDNAYEKLSLKCKEYDFYYTQNLYIKCSDEKLKKTYFDKLFFMVQFAVENAMKIRFGGLAKKGVVRNDLYDLTMVATLNIMSRYKKPKGYKIMYLLTTADYAALYALHNPRQRFWDSMMSLESWNRYEYNKEEKD